ncbi:WD40 repeat domain-containing protein [Streptomyces sp. NPDC056503]|uniref:WD40 repeat domain-containing protein n=1 Tax=Streptomyces sp. NPDC056503 TaxID=3345842 RepID=UPI0036A5CA48
MEGEEWASARPLPAETTAFLRASRQRQDAAVRRTKRLNLVLAGLLALALLATGIAFYQQDAAVEAQHVAQSRQLAALSTGLAATRPDLSSLLAVKAWRTHRTEEAASALYGAPAVPLERLFDADSGVNAVAYAPDGGTLATGSEDGTARLWDVRTGKPRLTLTGHTKSVSSVAFAPDGATLATGSFDGTARLWDARTGRSRLTATGDAEGVSAVAISPDGATLATGGLNGVVRLWDTGTGKPREPVIDQGWGKVLDEIVFSPDGTMIATAGIALPLPGVRDAVRVWDARTGKPRRTLAGSDIARSVAFSPDSRTLAVVSGTVSGDPAADDTTRVRLWDMRTGEDTVLPGTVNAGSVAFGPDGTVLATSSLEGTVHLWNTRSHDLAATFYAASEQVSLAFSPDGGTLATGSASDGTARLWDVRSTRARATLTGADEDLSVWSTAFSPDGGTLATGSENGVRLWDGRTGAARGMLRSDDGIVHAAVFGSDGRTLVTGTGKREDSDVSRVKFWDVEAEKVRFFFTVEEDVSALALSPDGTTVATGAHDGAVRLWDARTGRARATLTGPTEDVRVWSVAFSHDGTLLAAGTDKGPRLWEVASGKARATPEGGAQETYFVRFDADDSTLHGASRHGFASRWDLRTGKARAVPLRTSDAVWSVGVSPDGALFAEGTSDAVRLWDVRTGEVLARLSGHTDMVHAVAFSPDGTRLATGSSDGSARLWVLPLRDAQTIADAVCDRLGRDFTREEKEQYLRDHDPAPVCPA